MYIVSLYCTTLYFLHNFLGIKVVNHVLQKLLIKLYCYGDREVRIKFRLIYL